MENVCESCVYFLLRNINYDEDKVEAICMIDRRAFNLDEEVTSCNFYNPIEEPNVEPIQEA